MTTTFTVFLSWADPLINHFYSPFITDASFTSKKVAIFSLLAVDGEKLPQMAGFTIRSTEDYIGHAKLPQNFVTVLGDDSRPLQKAAEQILGDTTPKL